jgi:hypothetical protein
MPKSKPKNAIEWQGGIFSDLPPLHIISSEEFDTGNSPPPPPHPKTAEVLVWMNVDGTVLHKQTFEPDQAALHVVASFLQAITAPNTGPVQKPSRLAISDSALAMILRKGLPPEVELVIEHTMQLDDMMEAEFDLVTYDIDTSVPAIAALLR